MIGGLLLAGLGFLFVTLSRVPGLGQLPGDFHYEGENVHFYFPLTTCLLFSVVLSLLLYIASLFSR